MYKKISNKTLTIVFMVLLVLVAISFLSKGSKNESSFRTDIIKIDTSIVSNIEIKTKTNENVKLFNTEEGWKLNKENKNYAVPERKVKNLFMTLLSAKTNRLIARGKEKWNQYEVDTSAARIKIYEENDLTLDLFIGKFAFQQPRTMNTYVRLANDTDIYEVSGFLSPSINKSADDYRNGRLFKTSKDEWKAVTFDYPDNSFKINFDENGNYLNSTVKVDSATTDTKMLTLARMNSSYFSDEITINEEPTHLITVEKHNGELITIKGYKNINGSPIISSENNEAVFNGSQNEIFEKIFINPERFIKGAD